MIRINMKIIDNRKYKYNELTFSSLKIGDIFQLKNKNIPFIFMKINDEKGKCNSVYLGKEYHGHPCVIFDNDVVVKLETTLIIDS